MVLFNNGESQSDVTRWLGTRIRLPHASALINQAKDFDTLDRFLLEKLVHREGLSNRLRIEADATGEAVIRAGSLTKKLSKEGLKEAAAHLSTMGLKSYQEISEAIPSDLRYNASGNYLKQLEMMVYDPLRKQFGDDVVITKETFNPRHADRLRDTFMVDGRSTAIMRNAGEETGMNVVRARLGRGGRYLTHDEMMDALQRHSPLAINDPGGKLAKRLGSVLMNESASQIELDKPIKAGFINAELLFKAIDKSNKTSSRMGPKGLSKAGTLAPDSVDYLVKNPTILNRAMDGALMMDETLLDTFIGAHKGRVKRVEELIKNGEALGGYEAEAARGHKEQVARLKKLIDRFEKLKEGGRGFNFRALGFDPTSMNPEALGIEAGDTETFRRFMESLAKGDVTIIPKGKGDISNYKQIMKAFQGYLDEAGDNTINLAETQLFGFVDMAKKRGLNRPGMALVGEIGMKMGSGKTSMMLDPTEILPRVRSNVENITSARYLFRGTVGLGDDSVDYFGAVSKKLDDILETSQRTGALPVGYLKDLTIILEKSEIAVKNNPTELKRLRDARNRASRLLERSYTNASLDDPIIVREFSNMLKATMQRGGGKIDPLYEMPGSVYAHISSDVVGALDGTLPNASGDALGMMRAVPEDHIALTKSGFVMNAKTAGEAYWLHGGYDMDDALESHLRWSKNSAGRVELYSLTTRTPLTGSETGAYKVYGFDESRQVTSDLLRYTKNAIDGNIEGEDAHKVMAGMKSLADRYDELLKGGMRDDQIERSLGKSYDRIRDTFYSVAYDGDLEDYITKYFSTDDWSPDWRENPVNLARSLTAPQNADNTVTGVNTMMDDFIQRFMVQQRTLSDKALPEGVSGWEYSKKMFDRRLRNQVGNLHHSDPLFKLASEGELPSDVFARMGIADKKTIIGSLAERGVINDATVDMGGEKLSLWESSRGGGFELNDDRIGRFISQQDPDVLKDILENRILKMDTMTSYEAWANDFINRPGSNWDEFKSIVDSTVATGPDRETQSLLDEIASSATDKQGRVDWTRSMISQFDVLKRNPGLIGRSVNLDTMVQEMNSGLLEMQDAGLIDSGKLRRLRGLIPSLDTETLIDTLTQGTEEGGGHLLERIARVYHGQVAGLPGMMKEMEQLLTEVSLEQGIPMPELVERYGISWGHFENRLGSAVLGDRSSAAGKIFSSAYGEAFGIEGMPDSPEGFRDLIRGNGLFGGGEMDRQLAFMQGQLAKVDEWTDARLRSLPEGLPEFKGEIFSRQELEAADYLQKVYGDSRQSYLEELTTRHARSDNVLMSMLDELQGTTIDDLADEMASRSVISTFAENFVGGKEVGDDAWRIAGAFIKSTGNNKVINSSNFSPILSGTSAFFRRKKLIEEYGSEAADLSPSQLYARAMEEGYEAQDPILKKQIDTALGELDEFEGLSPEDSMARARRIVADQIEENLTLLKDDLMKRGMPKGVGAPQDAIPDFESFRAGAGDAMRSFTDQLHDSIYKRLSKDKISQYMKMPAVKKSAFAALGVVAFSFMHQGRDKTEEDMLGPSLPGGGSYRTPIPTTQMEIASQYVPPAASGVTYNVNVRGGNSGIRGELESLTGLSSGGSRYNSLPKPQGSRGDFANIESIFG